MKKMIPAIVLIALMLLLIPVSLLGITAKAATSGDYTYRVSNGEATITKCNTSVSGAIVIPATLDGYYVTSIGDDAFMSCTNLTSIEIPSGVTSIGGYAFYGCANLADIEIPANVTSIGDCAFYGCSSLVSITLPDGVPQIGNDMFKDCTSLTNVKIPAGVKSIGGRAFFGCTNLVSVEIPSGVTSIDYYAFAGCTKLTNINIPSGMTSISDGVFEGCTSLTSIEIPSAVTSIGSFAFQFCTSLTNIEIPSGVTSIGEYAFRDCANLTSIEILSSVTSIGSYAFDECTSLTSITLVGDAPSIAENAFRRVTATVYYPANNPTWTEAVMQQYGGNITWFAVCENHSWINATCVTPKTCAQCGLIEGEALGHQDTNKDHICDNGCGTTSNHTYDDACDLICNICNLVRPAAPVVESKSYDSVTLVPMEGFEYGIYIVPTEGVYEIVLNNEPYHMPLGSLITYAPVEITFSRPGRYVITPDNEHVRVCLDAYGSGNSAALTIDVTEAGTQTLYFRYFCADYPSVDELHFTYTVTYMECITWQDSNVFTGLAEDTNYTFYQRVKASDIALAGEISPVLVARTDIEPDYTVTFVNWDGTVISTRTYRRGDKVVIPPIDPSRAADNLYRYTFAGWDKEVVNCAGNATYTATYEATRIYTVTFQNWDGTVISTQTYQLGDKVIAPRTPQKAADNIYSYKFAGWDKEVVKCAGDATYTATYEATYIEYRVYFVVEGALIRCVICHWGDEVEIPAAPQKAADNIYSYTFAGWDKEVVNCAGDATYTATFEATYIDYTVTFQNWDGTAISRKTYHWGDAVEIPTDPTRAADNIYSYIFAGWDKEIVNCAGDATYTATYDATSHQDANKNHICDNGCGMDLGIHEDGDDVDHLCDYGCGAVLSEHNYTAVVTEPTCTDEGYTTHTCACGDTYVDAENDALGHDYGDWYQTVAPGCTTKGEQRRDCARCNHFETVPIVATGHKYQMVVTAPTCEQQGYTTHTCHCGDSYVTDKVPAKGHTEVVDTAVAATCTKTGLTEGKHCSVCNKILIAQQTVKAKGHTEVVDPAVAATCTQSGLTEGKHCSTCKEVLVAQRTVNAKGHTEVVDAAVAATCTQTGLTEGKHCSDCGVVTVQQQTVNKAPHDEIVVSGYPATNAASGLTDGKKCFVCGKITVEQTEIPALQHTIQTVPGYPATCTEPGLTDGQKCIGCCGGAMIVEQTVIQPTGHEEEVVQGADATCTKPGLTEGIVCKTCGAELKKQEEVPVIAHTEEVMPGVAATCTTPGLTDGIVCKICGAVVLEQEEIPVAPHTEVALPAVDATCTATGLTEGTMCSVCDQILQAQEEIPAIEHAFGQWQITEDATADKDGSKTRQCDVCGHTESESIPATGVPETEPTKPAETTPTTPATQPSAKPTEPTQKATEPTGNATAEPGDSETSTVLVVVIVAVVCVAGGLAGGLILGKKRRA